MSTSNDSGEKIAPEHSLPSPATLLAIAIIAIQVLVSIVTYPLLPDRVPSHWDASGHVNAYAPKLLNALLFPLLSIGIYLLVRILVAAGPRLSRGNGQRANMELMNIIMAGILLFMLIIHLTVTAIALGVAIDVQFVLSIAMSLLFIFIGNYLGKVRRNFWAGIRTPWTLSSEVVWERTHRLGGWLFVAVGLLGIVMSFVPFLRVWGLVVLLIVIAIFLTIYSAVLYSRYSVNGREPLSPPFDEENRD